MIESDHQQSFKSSFTNSPVAVVIISAKPHMVAPIPCVHYWCYNASSVIRITHAHQQVELYLFTSFRLRPPNDAVVGLAHLLLLAYRYQLVTCITMTDPPSASNLTSSIAIRSYNIDMANLVQHAMGYHVTKYRVQTLDIHRDMTVTNM